MFHLHCDADNLWVYESEFGAKARFDANRLYEEALPTLMDLFERFGARGSFFIIGRDLSLASCQEFCRKARARGHEIGNHSFSHPENFFELSYAEKEAEIARCDEVLSEAINEPITAFRAPGYYLDQDVVDILIQRGYCYDSSILPGVINQLMGFFISWRSGNKLNKRFGRSFYAVAPESISRITNGGNSGKLIFEVPVASCPFLRTPVHPSFIYLLGMGYFRVAAKLMSSFQRDSVILFHGIDALEYPADGELAKKVPAFSLSRKQRLLMIEKMLETMAETGFTSTNDRLKEMEKAGCKVSHFLTMALK